jgi:hypothetical protein
MFAQWNKEAKGCMVVWFPIRQVNMQGLLNMDGCLGEFYIQYEGNDILMEYQW